MIISDEIRKYVAFVAMRMAEDTFRLGWLLFLFRP
jgi:hypothetical protein